MTARALDSLRATTEYQAFCRVELSDPYDLLDELRSVAPVHWSPMLDSWVVTSYDQVNLGLRDDRLVHDRVAINTRGIPETSIRKYSSLSEHISNWLGFTDPPKHSRLREVAREMLNPALATRFRPWVSSYVRNVISEMQDKDSVDLLEDLALRLPLAFICEALGIHNSNADRIHAWTVDVGLFAGRVDPSWDSDAQQMFDRSNASWLMLEDTFRQIIEEKRKTPADDILTVLVQHFDAGVISEEEIIGLSVFFLAAGHGTTRDVVANGLYLLLTHPSEADKLTHDPHLVGSAVEEVLRYEGPIPMVSQLAVEDLTLGGESVRAGDAVILHLAAANRDPDKFGDAAKFDVARKANRHMAFGWGSHFCLGAPVARQQAAVVFEEIGPLLPRLLLDAPIAKWRTGDMSGRTLAELTASWSK
ncbi:MAG: cytochrome, partial [Acidimicrobiaceae bacterium]|nr:cytochrome [Acidimicrobiaceae bacterium]